jgi:hypothetical protein
MGEPMRDDYEKTDDAPLETSDSVIESMSSQLNDPGIQAIQGPAETGNLLIGAPDETDVLKQAFNQLESTDAGKDIAIAIRDKQTMTMFGPTDDNTIAQLAPTTNTITINEGLKEVSSNVLAAHLAHEGTHVQWNKADSIDQEYHAFKAEAEVWDQLKGDETDEQCDGVSNMIAQGEADAKDEIRRLYPDLPLY